jgi:hypothetical protein
LTKAGRPVGFDIVGSFHGAQEAVGEPVSTRSRSPSSKETCQ